MKTIAHLCGAILVLPLCASPQLSFPPATSLPVIVESGSSTNWSRVGTNSLNGTVRAIAEFGDVLYAGGDFTNASSPYLAKLVNGQWQALGNGVNGPVRALTVHGGRLFGRQLCGRDE